MHWVEYHYAAIATWWQYRGMIIQSVPMEGIHGGRDGMWGGALADIELTYGCHKGLTAAL